jgi:molecular chaperone Hsp33
MESGNEPSAEESAIEVRSYFVRGRNALLTRANMEGLYLEYYLHQGQLGVQHARVYDQMFKEALASMVLHAASRPWNETGAWTLHFDALSVNLFVVGDNPHGRIVGQIFTEDVKKTGRNLFCADVVRGASSPGRSTVEFKGDSVLGASEWFYAQSEQRVARVFEIYPEDFVLISAQPDCEAGWIEGLTLENVRALDALEPLSLLETRKYRWECGCNQSRMLDVLVPVLKSDPEGLFGEEPAIRMSCPRCGTKYVITRETLEAHARRC